MRVQGEFKFIGAESRPRFNDPTKMNYIVGLAQGLDTLRIYVEPVQFGQFKLIEPYSDVVAVLEYNPVAKSSAYAMGIVDIVPNNDN